MPRHSPKRHKCLATLRSKCNIQSLCEMPAYIDCRCIYKKAGDIHKVKVGTQSITRIHVTV